MNILQAKTEEAVRAIDNAASTVRATTQAVAAVVGLDLPERREAATVPEAVASFAEELGLAADVFNEFTAQLGAAQSRVVATALRPVALPAADVPAEAQAVLEGVNRLPVEQPAEAEEKGKRKRVTATNGRAH